MNSPKSQLLPEIFGNFSSLNQLDIYDGKILSKNTVLFNRSFVDLVRIDVRVLDFSDGILIKGIFKRNNGTSGNKWFVFVITTIGILYEKVYT